MVEAPHTGHAALPRAKDFVLQAFLGVAERVGAADERGNGGVRGLGMDVGRVVLDLVHLGPAVVAAVNFDDVGDVGGAVGGVVLLALFLVALIDGAEGGGRLTSWQATPYCSW